ncbi:MAG TPA: type II toxin-antitoxin system RelE/ParE family toxin, partial [Candidatus Acidoferrum sp.]|nr:type II toxin-antitoxin system RelE/ParE family toxin [Candidatus Acidoferrum sp.]
MANTTGSLPSVSHGDSSSPRSSSTLSVFLDYRSGGSLLESTGGSLLASAEERALGFSLRQLQIGREPTSQTRSMKSIGPGVYELKEADERTWYRAIYLSKIGNIVYVLHCFEKDSRKTDRRDIEIASQRLKLVRQRIQEQRQHEKRSGK